MRVGRCGIGMAVAAFTTTSAVAQFVQYKAPGSLASPALSTRERREAALEDARWRLGGLRLTPWFGVRDVTYYDDVLPSVPGKQSDLAATAGAGVAAFLPLGSKLMLAGHALPEYQWWREFSDRRGWGGRYAVGLAGYFNRLKIEAYAARNEQLQYASSESELPTNVLERRNHARIEVEVVRRLYVYASGQDTTWRYSRDDGATPSDLPDQLDRDETETAAGFRLEVSSTVKVSVGAKRTDVDFVHSLFSRSARGDGPTLALLLGTDRTGLDASIARFTIKPVGDSSFVRYTGTTGQVQVWRRLAGQLRWSVYGSRNLGFTAYTDQFAYYVQQSLGTAFSFPVGWRGTGSIYLESGSLDYIAGASGGLSRTDDVRAYGLRATFSMARSTRLFVGFSRSRYDSNMPGLDRTYTRLQTGIAFGTGEPSVW